MTGNERSDDKKTDQDLVSTKKTKKTSRITDVYECSSRTARLVIPRDRTPLRSFSTRSRSSSLHTSRESPVLPEGTAAQTQRLPGLLQIMSSIQTIHTSMTVIREWADVTFLHL